jgi:hypothetical protein
MEDIIGSRIVVANAVDWMYGWRSLLVFSSTRVNPISMELTVCCVLTAFSIDFEESECGNNGKI